MKRCLSAFALLSMICFLLLFPQEALTFARGGLLLWYQNLVPVLFPFMILSNLMIRTDAISVLLKWIHPLFRLIWGTSVYGSYAILAGFLFGYPMGAKVVSDLKKQGALTELEAEYLICFVNNLSPAFLITFLVHQCLGNPKLTAPTLGILYGAPLVTSMLLAPGYRSKTGLIREQKNKAPKVPVTTELLDACIFDGIQNITRLGAYILLFSLLTGALGLLPMKNPLIQCLLYGSLEITTGIRYTAGAALDPLTKYLCLMVLCSFGGICALMQTLSVCPMNRQTLRRYLGAKTLSAALSVLMTLLALYSSAS